MPCVPPMWKIILKIGKINSNNFILVPSRL